MRAFAAGVQVLGHQPGIALQAGELIAERAVGVMLKIARKGGHAAVDTGVLVNLARAAKTTAAAIEQAQHAIRIGVTVTQEGAEIFGRAREAVAIRTAEPLRLASQDCRTQDR